MRSAITAAKQNQMISAGNQLENRVLTNAHAAHTVLTNNKLRATLLSHLAKKTVRQLVTFYTALLQCFLDDQTPDISLKHLYIQNAFFILLRDTSNLPLNFNAFLLLGLDDGFGVNLFSYLREIPGTHFFGLVDIFCFYPNFLTKFCLACGDSLMTNLLSKAEMPEKLLKVYVEEAKKNESLKELLIENTITIVIELSSLLQAGKITRSAFKKMLSLVKPSLYDFIRKFLEQKDFGSYEKIKQLFAYPALVEQLDLSAEHLAKLYDPDSANKVMSEFESNQADIRVLVYSKRGAELSSNVKDGIAFVAGLTASTWKQLDPQRGWRGSLYRAMIFFGRPGHRLAKKLGLTKFFEKEEEKLTKFSPIFSEKSASLAARLYDKDVKETQEVSECQKRTTFSETGTVIDFPETEVASSFSEGSSIYRSICHISLSTRTSYTGGPSTTAASSFAGSSRSSECSSPALSRKDFPPPDSQAIREVTKNNDLEHLDSISISFSDQGGRFNDNASDDDEQDENRDSENQEFKQVNDSQRNPSPPGGRRPFVPANQGATFLNNPLTRAFSAGLTSAPDNKLSTQAKKAPLVVTGLQPVTHQYPFSILSM